MKKNVKNAKFDVLKSFCEISKKLEYSNVVMLHEFMPDFYPNVDLHDAEDSRESAFDIRRNLRHTECAIKKSEIKEIKSEIKFFSNYFGINEISAILLVAAYTKEIERETTFDVSDIVSFLDIKVIDFLPLKCYFEKLVEEGLFYKVMSPRKKQYKVNSSLALAIQGEAPYVKPEKNFIDRYLFCNEVSNLIEARSDEDINTNILFESVEFLENQNSTLDFVQNVKKINNSIEERTLFYECCDDFIEETRFHESNLEVTLADIYENVQKRMKVASSLMSGNHALIKSGMIERSMGTFVSEVSLKLSEKAMSIFLEDDIVLFQNSKKSKKLDLPENIKAKQLFYSPDLEKRVTSLTQSLMDQNFVNLQSRLEQESMPKGVSVIFYGAPGTGKTETALQIARQTGRKVYHVDISASKSCWFGESEKLIKRIFTDYREMCGTEEHKPILLFNEADALFSKRKNVGSSNVAQTENAIQNIILEELEKLDGILIATTNLADNLDPAFERRFVFKLKFDKPTMEAKKSIWKSKLAWLSDEECQKLATDYMFSGGEIDNIARKAIMEEVVSGERPNFDFIVEACKNERFADGQHIKIGF